MHRLKLTRERIALLLLILVLASLIFAASLRGNEERQIVQAALDATCGQDTVMESSGTYDSDPIWSWYSPKASCFKDIAAREITCHCN
jgi:hypothetical protein